MSHVAGRSARIHSKRAGGLLLASLVAPAPGPPVHSDNVLEVDAKAICVTDAGAEVLQRREESVSRFGIFPASAFQMRERRAPVPDLL